jgi:Protein of unknown function (DUF559)
MTSRSRPSAECRLRRHWPDASDSRPDVRVARLAAEQWGVLSLDELRACGLTRDAVSRRVRGGRLHPMYRAVYAVGHANLPLEGRFLAAVKACGAGAVLSHFSAAALWGFVDWDDRRLDVTVTGTTIRTHSGLRVHRTCVLDPADVIHHRGVRVTSAARTLVDLASVLDVRALRRAVRQAQALQRVSIRQLLAMLDRLGPRRGTRQLAGIIGAGAAPTRSELEDVVLDVLLRGGLSHPAVNVALVLDGRRVVPDFRWPAQRLVVEADGAAWHDSKLARQDDAARQALLESHGERVLRVTWDQAIAHPPQTLARLRAAGAPPAVRRLSSLSA